MSSTKLYAGIDVSKARLDVALRPTGECWSIANDQAGIDSLVGRLLKARPAASLVLLEATGELEHPIAAALVAAQIPVAVLNPRQARDFARATGQLAKTRSTPRSSPTSSPRRYVPSPDRSPTKKPANSPLSWPGLGARSST